MNVFRAKRTHVLVAGIAVIVLAAVLLVVLPAAATPANAYIKPRSVAKNIMPWDVATGGQSDDCAVFYPAGGGPTYQYRISNPKTKTYSTTVGGRTVTFSLTMNPTNLAPPGLPGYTNDKYVSISSTGAMIVDIGIKEEQTPRDTTTPARHPRSVPPHRTMSPTRTTAACPETRISMPPPSRSMATASPHSSTASATSHSASRSA